MTLLVVLLILLLSGCGKEKPGVILSDVSCAGNTLTKEDLTLPEFDIKISFTGDMILTADKYNTRSDNFHYYTRNYPKEYFLDKVRHIFEADDFTCVNLESVFSDRDLQPRNKGGGRAFCLYTGAYACLWSRSAHGHAAGRGAAAEGT